MNKQLQRFTREYVAALKRYVTNQNEAGLETAYRLGREAVAGGLGVLDMTRLHQEAQANASAHRRSWPLKAAENFLLETLSPFEVTHRGFQETNARLAQLNKTLAKRNGDLAALSNQVLHLQEEERKRISRELHDEVGQALTAISVTLAGMKKNGAPAKFKRKIRDVQKLLGGTMETIHSFAGELRPPMLDELGLLPALRSIIKTFSRRTKTPVRFRGDPAAERLSAAKKTVLFRVAQECLTNVTRHARAKSVEIAIRTKKNRICMTVADDGRSFKHAPRMTNGSNPKLGMLGMQERVRLIHGEFNILARPSKGTTIRVIIPLLDNSKGDSATLPAGQ